MNYQDFVNLCKLFFDVAGIKFFACYSFSLDTIIGANIPVLIHCYKRLFALFALQHKNFFRLNYTIEVLNFALASFNIVFNI